MGGIAPQPPPVCSIHLDDATAATGQRHQCARHTPATGAEERFIVPIKCMLSPQPATGGEERERHRPNQVDALTTHQLQVERRERHRPNQVDALTTHQLQVERRERHRANQVDALTTHQLQVGRRERQSQSSGCET